jgi:hypothetical protein
MDDAMDDDFISEDDLLTFVGYMKYQGYDPAMIPPEEIEMWRNIFDEVMRLRESSPKIGTMNLRPEPDGRRYAVAIRDGADLWLTMWIRCSPKGNIVILYPRGDRVSNPHASYHRNGRFHQKSANRPTMIEMRQPLTGQSFTGSEHLGAYGGHGKSAGAVCDPKAFDGMVIVEPGILEPSHGSVVVDLVEPGYEPKPDTRVHQRQLFP